MSKPATQTTQPVIRMKLRETLNLMIGAMPKLMPPVTLTLMPPAMLMLKAMILETRMDCSALLRPEAPSVRAASLPSG
jgi:hypothetical protein